MNQVIIVIIGLVTVNFLYEYAWQNEEMLKNRIENFKHEAMHVVEVFFACLCWGMMTIGMLDRNQLLCAVGFAVSMALSKFLIDVGTSIVCAFDEPAKSNRYVIIGLYRSVSFAVLCILYVVWNNFSASFK